MKITTYLRIPGIEPGALVVMAALFFVALTPRLLWVTQNHPAPFSDMEDYVISAAEFARGGYLAQSEDRLAYRPPLYPTLIAYLFLVFPGDFLLVTRILQAILSSVTCLFIFGCISLLTKPLEHSLLPTVVLKAAPVVAGFLYAMSGSSIFFTGVLMTESVYLFLLTGWLWLGLVLQQDVKPYWLLVVHSLLLGILALVRPISLFLIPIVVVMALTHVSRNQWKTRIWLPVLAWILPILPWTIRNFMVFGAFVLISTNSGVNLYIGQHPNYSYWHTGGKEQVREHIRAELGPDEVAEDRVFLRTALASLAQDPIGFFPRAGLKLYYLYWLDAEPWPWAEYRMEKQISRLHMDAFPFFWWNPIWLPLVFAGFLYASLYRCRHSTLFATILLYTAACCIYFARTRFRMPLEPILIVYMVFGLLSMIEMGQRLWYLRSRSKKEPEQT